MFKHIAIVLLALLMIFSTSPIDAQVQRLLTGFVYTEGPVVDKNGNLFFTDYKDGPGRIYKWNCKDGLSVFVADAGRANGLAINNKGEIVACQAIGRVVAFSPDGKKCRVRADGFNGRRFNAPNDLTIDSQDGIYFTDPFFEAGLCPPQRVAAVYYLAPDGKVTRLIDNLRNPNGIVLSPHGERLYVIPTCRREVMAYPVLEPGKLGCGCVFARPARALNPFFRGGDGGAVDPHGNLYVASARGVQVFDEDGNLLRIIRVPERPSNVAVSNDGTTLYITAGGSVYVQQQP